MISVGLLAEARAQILFSVDSPTELTGSFSEAGFNFSASSPVNFASLPAGGAQTVYAARFPNNVLETLGTGSPDNPHYDFSRGTGPATLSGTYTNGGASGDQEVSWSFYNMHDDGSTFTGNFSFTVATVPEPAAVAGVSALGLAAFALFRRRQARN
ncbi:MAG TPA: PEP-CTERM sorting domain-containing protein [Candidatus Limnocylindria bacterium]|nr:PEP-CTERM sorting domain-containing protein [Candidatus Limnocylindria bacterium]